MMPKAMNIVVSGLVGLLVFSSPSASQDHVVPLDESLTILEWAEVSSIIAADQPELLTYLREDGQDFSPEIFSWGALTWIGMARKNCSLPSFTDPTAVPEAA